MNKKNRKITLHTQNFSKIDDKKTKNDKNMIKKFDLVDFHCKIKMSFF